MTLGLLSKLGDWKTYAMIAMGIVIIALLSLTAWLSFERSDLKEKIGDYKVDIVNLKKDVDELVVSLKDSETSVKNLKDTNDTLVDDIKNLHAENNKSLETQRKLLTKISSLEKKGVTPSPSNPNKPLEHFYFDEEMVDLINTDVLGIKVEAVGPPAAPKKK